MVWRCDRVFCCFPSSIHHPSASLQELFAPSAPSGHASTIAHALMDGAHAIAILNVGLARTMEQPLVSQSFRLFWSELERKRHDLEILLWISAAPGGPEFASEWQARLKATYRATRLWVSSRQLSCNSNCSGAVPCSRSKDSAFMWLGQFFKVHLAWQALMQREQERGWGSVDGSVGGSASGSVGAAAGSGAICRTPPDSGHTGAHR